MRFSVILFSLILSACSGLGGKAKPPTAIYDFGLDLQLTEPKSSVLIHDVTASSTLNNTSIRYRMAHETPTRVFTYSESRWVAAPSILMSQAVQQLAQTPALKGCTLNIDLVTFDHVFNTLKQSEGIIAANATIVHRKTRQIVAKQQFQARAAAITQDAQGGVGALREASKLILVDMISWSNQAAMDSAVCQ
jgi:cholesterol transport system auxiliary component